MNFNIFLFKENELFRMVNKGILKFFICKNKFIKINFIIND